MDRDTKIGLVLALAFVGLVGAVLYHKVQNPETLFAATSPMLAQTEGQGEPVVPTTAAAEQPTPSELTMAAVAKPQDRSEEPPPPAPPGSTTPFSVPGTAPVQPSPRVAEKSGTATTNPKKWYQFWKPAPAQVARQTVSPPPLVPSGAPTDSPLGDFKPPPPLQTPTQPPVARNEAKWFQFWKRGKKETSRPTGLTFDPPPVAPTRPPEKLTFPPMAPPTPPRQEVAQATPGSKASGAASPGPPNWMPPLAKKEEPAAPSVPFSAPVAKKEESTTPSAQFQPPVVKKEEPGARLAPMPPSLSPAVPQPKGGDEPRLTPPPSQDRPVVNNELVRPTDSSTPPIFRPESAKPVTTMPAVGTKENRTGVPMANVKPLPSSETVDRHFPAPARLGSLAEEKSGAAQVPSSPSPPRSQGQAVVIREQPDFQPARPGIPVVTRPTAPMIVKEYPRPQIQVKTTEIRTYTPRQNETYTLISRQLYGHEKYDAALAQFNKDRDPKLATISPGQRIFYPNREYLEQTYPGLIGTASSSTSRRSPLDASGPTSQYVPPGGTQLAETRITQASARTPSSVDGSRREQFQRYRVREKDSLFTIAKRTLGNGDRWTEIYALNKELLPDPNRPELGLLLRLPTDAKLDTSPKPE